MSLQTGLASSQSLCKWQILLLVVSEFYSNLVSCHLARVSASCPQGQQEDRCWIEETPTCLSSCFSSVITVLDNNERAFRCDFITHAGFRLSLSSPKPSIWRFMLEGNLAIELLSCSTKLLPRSANQTKICLFSAPQRLFVVYGSAISFQISPTTWEVICLGSSWPSACLLTLFYSPGQFLGHHTIPHICVCRFFYLEDGFFFLFGHLLPHC